MQAESTEWMFVGLLAEWYDLVYNEESDEISDERGTSDVPVL
jgi:hypothetical protein